MLTVFNIFLPYNVPTYSMGTCSLSVAVEFLTLKTRKLA